MIAVFPAQAATILRSSSVSTANSRCLRIKARIIGLASFSSVDIHPLLQDLQTSLRRKESSFISVRVCLSAPSLSRR